MAMIFGIERCSMNDGPGIRTTVFLKGCSLDCIWCHNPESKSMLPQLSYNEDRCKKCKNCKIICKKNVHQFINGQHVIDFRECDSCGKCVDNCNYDALKIIGFEMSAIEVYDEIIKDIAYYDKSNGGVTVSGGEPVFQIEFLEELLTLLQTKGIHTCIETSGYGDSESFKKICRYTDLFLFDIKADCEKHKKLTGVEKKCIMNNFDVLCEQNANIILRCPLVPGVNDTKLHFSELIEISKKSNVIGIDILPYHEIGKAKAKQTGLNYDISVQLPDNDKKNYWLTQLAPSGKIINKL